MDVIDLSARRAASQATPVDTAVCVCGDAWFEIRIPDTASPGAVCMRRDGTISGYSGVPHCFSCGTPWYPR